MGEQQQADKAGMVKCVDCGFFYGYTSLGQTREDKEFDPDLLRTSLEKRGPNGSSIGMPRESHDWVTGIARTMREPDGMGMAQHWTWGLIDYMGCFKGEWGPWYRDMMGPFDQWIKREIEKPRECACFFAYEPGFSARQHLELQMTEMRRKATEEAEARRWRWTIVVAGAAAIIALSNLVGPYILPRFFSLPPQTMIVSPQLARP